MALDDRAIQEICELREHGGSIRDMARLLGVGKDTVRKYLSLNQCTLAGHASSSSLCSHAIGTKIASGFRSSSRHLYSYHRSRHIIPSKICHSTLQTGLYC